MSNNLNKALLSEGFIDTLIENEYFIDTLFDNEYFNTKLLSKIIKTLKYDKALQLNQNIYFFNKDEFISTYDEFSKLNDNEMIYVLDNNNLDSIITLIREACDKHWFHECFLKSKNIYEIIDYLINNNIKINNALFITNHYSIIYEILLLYSKHSVHLPEVYKLGPDINNFDELYQKMRDKRKLYVFIQNKIKINYISYVNIDTNFILKYLSYNYFNTLDFHSNINFDMFISIFKTYCELLDCSDFIALFKNEAKWCITINNKEYNINASKLKIALLLQNVYNIEDCEKAKSLLAYCLL